MYTEMSSSGTLCLLLNILVTVRQERNIFGHDESRQTVISHKSVGSVLSFPNLSADISGVFL